MAATAYELRLAGLLDDRWASWFGSMHLTAHDDGTTTLSGLVIDQAELHGLLAKVRDLGVPLLSVRVVEPALPSAALSPPLPQHLPRRPQ